jgi:hypothetical protein
MSEQATNIETELIEFVQAIDVRAPAELHERVSALVAEHARHSRVRSSTPRPRLRIGLGGLVAAAVVALVLILASAGGGGSAPTLTLEQANALTLRPATMAAPVENLHADAQLAANVDGVPFPYWEDRFGWRSTGARIDNVAGRTVMTVFYTNATGRRIGYAIVSGVPAPKLLSSGTVAWRDGTPYHVLRRGDSSLVVWLRNGRMCVVAGHGVSSATLLKLASWNDQTETT